jgi:class 3 adenylate cyclase
MAVKAGLALHNFLSSFNKENKHSFQMRVGIHTGEIMGGVVGKERVQFDVFGDDVNIASRFESSCMAGEVNVSHATYSLARGYFEFIERGSISRIKQT